MFHPCLNKVEVEKWCLKDVTEEVAGLVAPLYLRLQSLQGEGNKVQEVKTDEESNVRKCSKQDIQWSEPMPESCSLHGTRANQMSQVPCQKQTKNIWSPSAFEVNMTLNMNT